MLAMKRMLLIVCAYSSIFAQAPQTLTMDVCGTRFALKARKLEVLKEVARVGCLGGRPPGNISAERLGGVGDSVLLLKHELGKAPAEMTFEGQLSFNDGLLIGITRHFKSWETRDSVSVVQSLFTLISSIRGDCATMTVSTDEVRRPISYRSEAVVFRCGSKEVKLTTFGGTLKDEGVIGEAEIAPHVTIEISTILK